MLINLQEIRKADLRRHRMNIATAIIGHQNPYRFNQSKYYHREAHGNVVNHLLIFRVVKNKEFVQLRGNFPMV